MLIAVLEFNLVYRNTSIYNNCRITKQWTEKPVPSKSVLRSLNKTWRHLLPWKKVLPLHDSVDTNYLILKKQSILKWHLGWCNITSYAILTGTNNTNGKTADINCHYLLSVVFYKFLPSKHVNYTNSHFQATIGSNILF